MADDDDEGFLGYVPYTDDPGPIFLVVTIFTFVFLMTTLPIAVLLGEKRDALKKKIPGSSETDQDRFDSNLSNDDDVGNDNASNASASSKASFYSTVSDALRGIFDGQGRPARPRGFHKRNVRRQQALITNAIDCMETSVTQPPSEITTHPGIKLTMTTSTKSENSAEGHGVHPGPSSLGDTDGLLPEPPIADGSISHKTFVTAVPAAEVCETSLDEEENKQTKIRSNNQMAMEVTGSEEIVDRTACLSMDGFLDEMAAIMAFDYEMKRIIKLSLPFATQALFTGILDILTVGVLGKLVGTREVSAFVVVRLLLSLTTQFVGGFIESLTTLCSQAIGAKKYRLAGKYVQIATVLYVIAYIPFAIMWVLFLDDAIAWLGFDAQTVEMGQQYGYLLLVDSLVDGVSESIHALLDVSGRENYSTAIGSIEETLAFLLVLAWGFAGAPTILVGKLFSLGVIQFVMGIIFLTSNVVIIWRKGWFKPYIGGMFGTFALSDKKAVWLVFKTAMSLSFGYLLTDGEWEILTLFASFLGPAEVAAWGIFGTIWDAVNMLIDGIADASEVRCAFLLGCDKPVKARLSAYKSFMIGVFTSLFTTSLLYILGDDLPKMLTNDPTLQVLLHDLIPMFGLGNATMTLGTMSWTLLGAQGRYRLATVIVCIVSWVVTLPLAAICSIWLEFSLQGQTAAVVIGYMISGTIHAYFLFRSDWAALSQKIMGDNDSRASDDVDNDEISIENLDAGTPYTHAAVVAGDGAQNVHHACVTEQWVGADHGKGMEVSLGPGLS